MTNQREFRVTLIDTAGLRERLMIELHYLAHQARLMWPVFKRDPLGFARRMVSDITTALRSSARRDLIASLAGALILVFTAILLLIWIDNEAKQTNHEQVESRELAQMITVSPDAEAAKEDHGVGMGSEGRVGFRVGKGQGSAPEAKRSTGGGSGGLHNPLPAQVGKLPQPSEVPAPIPSLPRVQNHALPAAGIDIDPALWQNLSMPVYGDPRSKSSASSNGPGEDGGMGTGPGQGIGEGSGPGFGPGIGGNIGGDRKGIGGDGPGGSRDDGNPDDSDHVYRVPQVTERARVLAKPEPQYTEAARRNAIVGSVVLRAVFSRTGEVKNIRAIQALPFGLTERAIAAARLIRFRPATRDGRAVNVYMQLEYNFNLY
jgi:TonB family protein